MWKPVNCRFALSHLGWYSGTSEKRDDLMARLMVCRNSGIASVCRTKRAMYASVPPPP